jgi:peptide deformylase
MMSTPVTERLRALGIRQQGDPILREVAARFALPQDASEARELQSRLLGYVRELRKLYPFRKGVGIAAPQIGVSRAMAVVAPPEGEEISLLNPVVMWESDEADEQFEGCLSLFDVRGRVVRPLSIRVEITRLDGGVELLSLERGVARLALHEIDHLAGKLYVDRVVDDGAVVSMDEYHGSGTGWEY